MRRFSMFQPTLPLRGATRRGGALRPMGAVSTHAPLAGSDSSASSTPTTAGGFNPRSSCGERREVVETKVKTHRSFQPTLPLRGATQITRGIVPKAQFQPTLPLRGATWTGGGRARRPSCFNPRSPCGERRSARSRSTARGCFNPRSPCGERHRMIDRQIRSLVVSTHAPLAGSDAYQPCQVIPSGAFQPTLPLRGATRTCRASRGRNLFQPTLPLRGATSPFVSSVRSTLFQPTLPLRGATPPFENGALPRTRFNPRSPCGERRCVFGAPNSKQNVSTHAPLAGSDGKYDAVQARVNVSTHAPLAGSDRLRPILRPSSD